MQVLIGLVGIEDGKSIGRRIAGRSFLILEIGSTLTSEKLAARKKGEFQ